MNETIVTLTGHVANEPRMRVTSSGARVTSFRLASTERRFNKQIGEWRDGDTIFCTVTCWRTLAENAFSSLDKGQPVLVRGRLKVGSYEREGQRRTFVEIEAYALGHDLARGVTTFTKVGPNAERDEVRRPDDDEDLVDPVTGELLDRPASDGFPEADAPQAEVPQSAA